MSGIALRARTPPAVPRPPALAAAGHFLLASLRPSAVVPLLVLCAAAARLPFLTKPLSPDEGGFLMVAAQWSPGTSLYGNYWVDRPPLLIGLFQLAVTGGGAVALRLMGIAVVVVSILLSAVVGRLVAPGRPYAAAASAATAAVFLSSPLFDSTEVNGELLAVPFVLAGLVAALRGTEAGAQPARLMWWTASGVAAVAAAGIKQSMLEGFVIALAVIGELLCRRRPRLAAEVGLAFAAGVTVAVAVILWWAAGHGTTPGALWDAVVSFRAEASAVISRSAPDSTRQRGLGVLSSFLVSGGFGLLLLATLPERRRRMERGALDPMSPRAPQPRNGSDVRVLATVVVVWEALAVVAGGSYWLHYLIGTVPGLVLTVSAVARHRPARLRWAGAVLGYAAVVALVAVVVAAVREQAPTTDLAVERYLAARAQPGDTGVVAFGDPALLQAAGLSSPYPELWSLPVRVRDPELTAFDHVLQTRDRPAWVVVSGGSLETWGVDSSAAQPILDREYRLVRAFGDWHVYHVVREPER